MDGQFRCPKCKWIIKVRGNGFEVSQEKPSFERNFPAHPDCELGKPLARMDFVKLERVRG